MVEYVLHFFGYQERYYLKITHFSDHQTKVEEIFDKGRLYVYEISSV